MTRFLPIRHFSHTTGNHFNSLTFRLTTDGVCPIADKQASTGVLQVCGGGIFDTQEMAFGWSITRRQPMWNNYVIKQFLITAEEKHIKLFKDAAGLWCGVASYRVGGGSCIQRNQRHNGASVSLLWQNHNLRMISLSHFINHSVPCYSMVAFIYGSSPCRG